MKKKVPQHLQGLLWSADVKNLDVERDKNYIIHNILMYGTFSDIKWLFEVYSADIIKTVFVSSPKKIYTKPVFRLIKDFVLDLKEIKLDEGKYVTTLH